MLINNQRQIINGTASKNDFKDIYAQMLTDQNSSYNQIQLTPEETARQSILGRVQFYGSEYYTPRR